MNLKAHWQTAYAKRQPLLIWSAWFYLANCFLFWIIGFKYIAAIWPIDLPFATSAGYALVYFFLFLAYIGHFALLAFIPCVIAILPFIIVLPRKTFILLLSVFFAALAAGVLIADNHLFFIYHFHLNKTILKMVFNTHIHQMIGLSQREWLYSFMVIIVLLVVESGLAIFIWYRFAVKLKSYPFFKILAALLGCLLFSYALYVISISKDRHELSQQTRALPFYDYFLVAILPVDIHLSSIERFGARLFTQPRQAAAKLHYPLHPLQCHKKKTPLNIIVIVVDTWRYDSLTSKIMPFLRQFADHSWEFKKHYSGGNSTLAGIFTLFYAIPSNYWTSMLEQKQGPVLFEILKNQGYHSKVISSSELFIPAFDKTAFINVPDLKIETLSKTPGERDEDVTRDFIHFIDTVKDKPFFTFLFYDAAHAYCLKQTFSKPFQPAIKKCNRIRLNNKSDPHPYINRYNNALHFVDTQLKQVITLLEKKKMLDNTVIIITGDHGQEFNDNKLNFWEHANNFTHYQVQTPLIVAWPRKIAERFTHVTSHYDIVPTVLRDILGCDNPPSDYSVGVGLMNKSQRDYIIAGSYLNFGVIEPDRLTTLYPSGNFQVSDRQGRYLLNATPRIVIMSKVLKDMRRFYQK